jgi:hypothetical protein
LDRLLLLDLHKTLKACESALRSYQYGNAAPDLAKSVADAAVKVIAQAEAELAKGIAEHYPLKRCCIKRKLDEKEEPESG